MIRLVLIFLLACTITSLTTENRTRAEPAPSVEPTREQLQIQISILQDHIKKLEADLRSHPAKTDPALEKAYLETRQKQYEYLRAIMDVNIGAYHSQRIASAIVLFLVVLVVVAGTAFAGYQLWKSVSVAGIQTSSDLELSASKVRVTSSVVGVIVLTISLVFLYIYTQEIYHIRVISTMAPANTTTPK